MKKRTTYTFYYENKTKGNYKIFGLLPALSVVRDTQLINEGYSAWEFYFEWLFFQISLHIQTQIQKEENE